MIQTVLGALASNQLGRVDAHEHVFLRSPALRGEEYGEIEPMTVELSAVRSTGIDTVVDLTPIGLGREPLWLAEVARRSGVQIIAATGFHRDAHYAAEHWAHRAQAEVLERVLLSELRDGIDARDWRGPFPEPTNVRAGIIKLGASYRHLTKAERTRFEAGVAAASKTGVAIAVHCEIGTLAAELLELAQRGGLPPSRVLLAHLDRNPDPELHVELADHGAFLVYDTIGRIKYRPDSVVLDLIETVSSRGGAGQLLLGTDASRRGMLRAYGGGPGMDVLGREFIPRLRKQMGDDITDALLRDNPARVLGGGDA